MHAKPRNNSLTSFVGIAIGAFLLSSLFFLTGIGSQINHTLTDSLYGGIVPLTNIAIIAIDDASLQEIGRWPWNRSVFANLVDHLHDSKVVAIDVAFFEPHTDDTLLGQSLAKAGNVIIPIEYTAFTREGNQVRGTDLLTPTPSIRKGAKEVGYVNILTDTDGVTRAINTDLSDEYSALPLAVANTILAQPPSPTTRYLINFAGPPGSFQQYSVKDVLNGAVPDSTFAKKIVFIGATSPDLHDAYFVPTSNGRAMPGVEILANVVQTLILGNNFREVPTAITLLLLLLASTSITLLFAWKGLRIATIATICLTITYFALSIFLATQNILVNIVHVPFAIGLTYLGSLSYGYLSRRKEQEKITAAFGKYISPTIINELLKDPSKLTLGGERKEVTIFFSDIRGFTSISEVLTPEQLVDLLNEYLTAMTDIIISEHGIVDKYMGDAIMAFWGAPLDQPNHAILAARASIRMQARLTELQQNWESRKIPVLHIGVGLNTGPAIVGNMGSTQRFDYTVMGDTINLGSRLEGVNKEYGTTIIASETTAERIKDQFDLRKLDKIKVKGKTKPVTIYELIGDKGTRKQHHDHFEEGLQHYLNQDWDTAITAFKKALQHAPTDGPARVFIERCDYLKDHPLPKDWDGSFVMKTK